MATLRTPSTHDDDLGVALRGRRVLLAEDDDGARTAMTRTLAGMGLDVIETTDGGRMLVAIAAHYKDGRSPEQVDLIVTDVCMPVIGGLELFKGLRAAGWMTPVVVVTGHDAGDLRETVARLDAVLLPKPLDLDAFEHVVRGLLRPGPVRLARGGGIADASRSACSKFDSMAEVGRGP